MIKSQQQFLIKKKIYLVILYILFLDGMNLSPLAIIGADGFLILIFLFLFFGKHIYSKTKAIKISKGYYRCIYWILTGIFLSMISAKMYYNQSISQSILSYRTQYLMLTPLFLVKMRFTEKDFIDSLYIFSWIYTGFYILRAIIPSLFVLPENYDPTQSTSFSGYALLTIPLYYTLQSIIQQINLKKISYAFFLIAIIFLQENRSTLFPVIVLSGLMLLKIKSKFKIPLIILLSIIIAVLLFQIWDTIQDLIDQTQRELNDPQYNRNKAFTYFIEIFSPNLWCTIFGNGFLSFHSTPIMQLLMEQGIYNSDLGFIGYWNQFGVIPIIVFLGTYLTAIFSKKIPLYIKAIAIQTLICGLTISYFGSRNHMIFFIVFYYLFFLEYSSSKSTGNRYGKIYYPV